MRKCLLKLWLYSCKVIVCLVFSVPCIGQQTKVNSATIVHKSFEVVKKEVYTIKHPVNELLPSTEVYDIMQDSKGYMWFSTDRGVVKYNGETAKKFGVAQGLKDIVVFESFEDSRGWVWLRTKHGVKSYIYKDSIYIIDHGVGLNDVNTEYGNIVEDDQGNIWFGTNNRDGYVQMYDRDKKQIIPYLVKDSLKHANFVFKIFRNNQALFTGHICPLLAKNYLQNSIDGDSIYFAIHTGDEIEYIPLYNNDKKSCIKDIRKHKTLKNTLLFSERNNLFIYKKGENFQLKYSFDNRIIKVTSDKNENIWIGTLNGGVYCLKNNAGDTLEHYLGKMSVSDVLFDREGGTWFSTTEGGVFYAKSLLVEKIRHLEDESGDYINGLTIVNNQLYISERFNTWNINNKGITQHQKYHDVVSIKSLKWLNKCYVYLESNQFINGWYLHDDIGGNYIEIGNRTAFYGGKETNNYSFLWSRDTLLYKNLLSEKWKIIPIPSHLTSVAEWNNCIWLGDKNGLKILDTDKNVVFDYIGFPQKIVELLATDSDLYIATKNNGLFFLSKDKYMNKELPKQIPGSELSTINDISINQDKIFAATTNGLKLIDTSNKQLVKELNKRHGIPSNEIRHVEIYNGFIYLANYRYVAKLPLHMDWDNGYTPKIWLERITVNDSIYQNTSKLAHNENNITIHVANDNYAQQTNTYLYKFDTDKAWTNFSSNKLSFLNLSPNKYHLQIKAINEDGIESKQPLALSFHISPPWYQTSWFYVASIAIFMLIVFFIMRAVNKAQLKKQAVEETYKLQLSKMEMKALRAQMNPHFLFNSVNSIQYFLLKNKGEEAKDYLAKFSKMVRIILNHTRKENILIEDEVEALKLYLELEKVRFEKEFEYSITHSSNIDEKFDKIPVMLVQPFVENAIWHGLMPKKDGQGRLKIHFDVVGDAYEITVEDNGIGREASKSLKKNQMDNKRTSLGMQIITERMNLYNRSRNKKMHFTVLDLYNQDNKASGTAIKMVVPF